MYRGTSIKHERHSPNLTAQNSIQDANRDVLIGAGGMGRGSVKPPIVSKLQGSWPKVSNAARKMVPVLSVTFLSNSSWSNGQNTPQ